MLVQQIGKIVPGIGEHRISACRSPERRFRPDVLAVSPEHVAEVERWCCIRGIALDQGAVEPLSFGNVAGVLCRLCLPKLSISILLGWTYRQHKLATLIGSPFRLFDFEGVVTGGM